MCSPRWMGIDMIVESTVENGVRTITLNRPPANAITIDMMHAIRDAFEEASADWDTRAVVFESNNPRFFSGGWDIKNEGPDPSTLPPAVGSYSPYMGREVFRSIYECGVPVIAKVRGTAVGAGLLYVTLCDFAVASETAQFGQFEIKIGAVGGTGMLRRMMSEQAMRYMTWTGELVPVSKLVALGAGITVVPDEALDDEVAALAHLLASRDADLIRHSKYAFNQVERLGALESYAIEQMHSGLLSKGQGSRIQPDHQRNLRSTKTTT